MTKARSDKSIILFAALITAPLFFVAACTTTKMNDGNSGVGDPASSAPNESGSSPNTSEELPPELLDAQRFDPVTTMDQKTIQESDFYQIKQSVEQNKNALDEGWKEQDRVEALIKATDKAAEEKNQLPPKRKRTSVSVSAWKPSRTSIKIKTNAPKKKKKPTMTSKNFLQSIAMKKTGRVWKTNV